jgi:hypothetical protein
MVLLGDGGRPGGVADVAIADKISAKEVRLSWFQSLSASDLSHLHSVLVRAIPFD